MRYILSLLLLGLLRRVNPDRTAPLLENLALRQQLAALNRKAARPRLGPFDRVFWALLASLWSDGVARS